MNYQQYGHRSWETRISNTIHQYANVKIYTIGFIILILHRLPIHFSDQNIFVGIEHCFFVYLMKRVMSSVKLFNQRDLTHRYRFNF